MLLKDVRIGQRIKIKGNFVGLNHDGLVECIKLFSTVKICNSDKTFTVDPETKVY